MKRINIAMELVSLARPALLLLDEPTSGKTGFKIDPRFKMPILHMKIPSFVWILSRFGMMLGLDAAIANELFENLHKLSRSGNAFHSKLPFSDFNFHKLCRNNDHYCPATTTRGNFLSIR